MNTRLFINIISWFMSCVSGSPGSGELACGLHPELQWNKASEWTHSPAQTSGSGPRDRLHRDHRCLHHCWQVQSPANRWPSHFPSGISNHTLYYAYCKCPSFCFPELKQAQTMMNALQWTSHPLLKSIDEICPFTWNVLLRKKETFMYFVEVAKCGCSNWALTWTKAHQSDLYSFLFRPDVTRNLILSLCWLTSREQKA